MNVNNSFFHLGNVNIFDCPHNITVIAALLLVKDCQNTNGTSVQPVCRLTEMFGAVRIVLVSMCSRLEDLCSLKS